ncbi:MAG: Hsp20/alpha crystallin family protein [Kiritimatiellia bacterium]|nr:Hsp20/alpha crystallin family protein [Kiritimatiellia bacterium]
MIWTNGAWNSDPFSEIRRLHRDMNRLFSGYGDARDAFPAVNLWSDTDKVTVKAEIPGVEPKDIDVSVQGDLLTLRGDRKAPELPEDCVCHRAERVEGQFLRTIRLPFEVDANQVEAKTALGILTLKLPRAETSKPRRIAIQAG